MPRYRRARQPQSPRKHWWRWAKLVLLVTIIATVSLAYYLKHLDRLIAEKFDQPRRWNLPSRVFSDAEYLYPGVDIDKRRLIAKLDRLGYRDVGQTISGPGDYARASTALDIHLHDFDYPEGPSHGFPIRLELAGSVISRVVRTDTQETQSLVRLEPEMVASIFDERMEDRTIVQLADVPPKLLEAIILVEDNRFFRHHGVDPIGIIRAIGADFAAMRIVQGGSTLTQQLVKNYFLHPRKSFLRKLNEALIAIQIERRHTKGEILQAYLNEIYLGQRGASSVSGVSEAAKFYFAKNVNQLTLAECALLAGMIRSPNEYNPLTHVDHARSRRNLVLALMHDATLIGDEEYTRATAEPIITPKGKVKLVTAPSFIDYVKHELAEFYSEEVLESEGLRIFTTLDMEAQFAAEEAVTRELAELERTHATLLPADHAGRLEACLLAIGPANGYIRAMVGGRDYTRSQFNHCTQALRQPGSTFKPFVYLTALDPKRSQQPFTAANVIADTHFSVTAGGEAWSPENYDHQEHGPVTLRTALEQSYNIATAKLAIEAGLTNVVQTARDAGIRSPLLAVPALALGAFEVSPLELAAAYTIFPGGGIQATPIAIMHVVTKEGTVLERRAVRMSRKFAAGPIAITTGLLKGVIDHGTGMSARARGVTGIVAGKTGTTSEERDAWFVGFTPEILALVWVGYDDNTAHNLTGAQGALPLWAHFIRATGAAGTQDFPSPPGVILVKVDRRTGGLTTPSCPDFIYEAFLEGTEPDYTCEHAPRPGTSAHESY